MLKLFKLKIDMIFLYKFRRNVYEDKYFKKARNVKPLVASTRVEKAND